MGFQSHDPLRTHHWDSLEKALTVFVPPGQTTRRRVDLIFAAPEVYWTAVVGWCAPFVAISGYNVVNMQSLRTGSTMFERDLRSVAKLQYVPHIASLRVLWLIAYRTLHRGMKFDSSGMYALCPSHSRMPIDLRSQQLASPRLKALLSALGERGIRHVRTCLGTTRASQCGRVESRCQFKYSCDRIRLFSGPVQLPLSASHF